MTMPKIDLKTHPPISTLFDTDASTIASELDESAKAEKGGKEKNKTAQIRRFYDELVGWQERIGNDDARFKEYEAFVKMLNAKAAYAQGRNLVTQDFVVWFRGCVGQVSDARSLKHFRLHFEAMLGFLKAKRG